MAIASLSLTLVDTLLMGHSPLSSNQSVTSVDHDGGSVDKTVINEKSHRLCDICRGAHPFHGQKIGSLLELRGSAFLPYYSFPQGRIDDPGHDRVDADGRILERPDSTSCLDG